MLLSNELKDAIGFDTLKLMNYQLKTDMWTSGIVLPSQIKRRRSLISFPVASE
jgi:hypothetical protein